jgi:phosphopantothenoylcysteine decarboxylase/phosphopantothenate--cysteine ligase
MPEVEFLYEALEYGLAEQTLAGRRILITAGPTQEPLDPVRYLSNYSTGKMGFALARECARRGADVTLVSGPTAQTIEDVAGRIHRIDVVSAQEMHDATVAAWQQADTAILCAAVADFAPEQTAADKIKKQPGQTEFTLRLRTTPDIAAALGTSKQKGQRLIGFALETTNEQAHALRKLDSKNMDAIVLNSLRDPGAGFGTDTNTVTILTADGSRTSLPLQSKAEIASGILDALL